MSLEWQPAFIKHIISSLKRVNEKFLCIKKTGGMGFKEKKKNEMTGFWKNSGAAFWRTKKKKKKKKIQ